MKLVLLTLFKLCLSQMLVADQAIIQDMVTEYDARGRPINDPSFKPIESHYLSFPILEKDFDYW